MADDDNLAPVEELEPIAVPEDDGAASEPDPQEDDPIAKLASELGWAPKDQFRGNPEEWKPADEFIRAGRDIQKTLYRDVKDLRSTVDNMSRTSAALLEQQLERQRAELEARFQEAVETGDTAAARQASADIAKLETAPAARPSVPPTPEGQSFAEKHKWFGQDKEATSYAVSRAQIYADQGLSPARQIAAVEKDMRDIFPDLFPAPAKPAPAVAQPASRTASTAGRAKGFHDMPAAAQAAARDMADRGVIPNVDAYVVNYFKQVERKVG